MQLVNPVRCPEVMVQSVHIVVQDPNSDRKAMRVGRTLVESVDTLERARRAGVELADTVVGCEVVAHYTHRGRPVGEPITRGKEAGLGAPLTHDVERPAAQASRLESKPGDSWPGGSESTGTNQHVASDEAGIGESTGGETGSDLRESSLLFVFSLRIGNHTYQEPLHFDATTHWSAEL